MNRADLHCHTTASDGRLAPLELLAGAEAAGCRYAAITDHDTLGGIVAAEEYRGSLVMIPGIEFSIDFQPGSFHLLGLGIDHRYVPLVARTGKLAGLRLSRTRRILDRLGEKGIVFPEGETDALKDSVTGRPHIARLLVRHGHAVSIEAAFRDFLAPGKAGYVPKPKIDIDEALSLVKDSGGLAFIAHPVSLELEGEGAWREFFGRMKDSGVAGIEVYSPMQGRKAERMFLEFAGEFDFLVSGGSDFHGDRGERFGYSKPYRRIPGIVAETAEMLAARSSSIIR